MLNWPAKTMKNAVSLKPDSNQLPSRTRPFRQWSRCRPVHAVEARVPAVSFERACQTTSSRGSEHGCCEEVVQITDSISRLASRKCWKCGEKGHLRKDCRNKRKRRRSAPKADNLREVCASANQGGSQPSQTVWVFAISDVGGPQKMGGPVSLAHAPTPQPASISSVNLEEIVKLVLKSLKRKKKKRRQKNG